MFATYASGPVSTALVGVGLVLLVLGIAGIALLASRWLAARSWPRFRRRSPWRGRSRSQSRSGFDRAEGEDSLPPGHPSVLFPPSHHEKLHDPKYLRRILLAEEQRLRESRRRCGEGDRAGSGGLRDSDQSGDDPTS